MGTTAPQQTGAAGVRRPVIIDCDPGIDDAQSIAMLAAADQRGEIQLLGITTTAGNASLKNCTRNARRVLGLLGRTDIPIYAGAHCSLVDGRRAPGDTFHGANGLGDVHFDTPLPDRRQEEEVAAVAMVRLARQYKGALNIVALAPLTNLAMAIRLDDLFVSNTKDIYVMGGNYTGMGNTTPSGEFNFFSDPESASIVLQSVQRPINICTWEVCLAHGLDMEWRTSVLGGCDSPAARFFNAIEQKVLEVHKTATMFKGRWVPCDQLAAAAFIRPEVVTKKTLHHAVVETRGQFTHGQMVVDRRGWQSPGETRPDWKNIQLLEIYDLDLYKKMLLNAYGHQDVSF